MLIFHVIKWCVWRRAGEDPHNIAMVVAAAYPEFDSAELEALTNTFSEW